MNTSKASGHGLRDLLLKALRVYAHTPLRGRSRIISMFHPLLCRPGNPAVERIFFNGVPFDLDLAERSQISMYYGFYEPNEVAFLRRVLQPGCVFVDIGANVGYYSAVAASRVGPLGVVHAFEPVPCLFARLQHLAETTAQHGYQIVPTQAALSNRGGETTIYVSRGSNIGWSTIVPGLMDEAEVKESHTVPVMRLDKYFRSGNYRPPDVVKVDVEGADADVIEGMSGLFEAGVRPVLMVEVHDYTADRIRDLLMITQEYAAFRCLPGGRLERVGSLHDVKAFLVVLLPR